MCKHFKGVIFALLLLFIPTVNAEETCSYSEQAELNTIAANVQAKYDIVDIYAGKALNPDEENSQEEDLYIKGLKISVLNITEDITVKLINKATEEEKTYNYKDATDGVISFETDDVDEIVNYTIEVYANKYKCAGKNIRKFEFMVPRYNEFSEFEACNKNPDFYYCQEFLMVDKISRDEFFQKIEEYEAKSKKPDEQKEDSNLWNKIGEFYHKHQAAILIVGSAIVVGGVVTTVILVKKRRSRVL